MHIIACPSSIQPSIYIEPYTNTLFVWNFVFSRWYKKVSAGKNKGIITWIGDILCGRPFGYYTSFVHHLAQVIFGYKLKWRVFYDKDQEERYKELQNAMQCFEFNLSSVLTLDQETIDNKYNEINDKTPFYAINK
eukprot:33596_1